MQQGTFQQPTFQMPTFQMPAQPMQMQQIPTQQFAGMGMQQIPQQLAGMLHGQPVYFDAGATKNFFQGGRFM